MPEGAHAYPRWEGPMRTGTIAFVIANQETRRAFNNVWTWVVIGVFAVFQFFFTRQEQHDMPNYVKFVNDLRWVALAVTAIMAGPAFLDDQRRGALELYLARAVTMRDYLWGKILAVFGVSTLLMWLPALATYLTSFAVFDEHPAGWHQAPWGALVYSIMWGAVVSALGLGLSCVSRNSRAATLILFLGFAGLEIVVRGLLTDITANPNFALVSPFAALRQQTVWLFRGIERPYAFQEIFGLLEFLALVGLGIFLIWWRHPRVRGDEPARS